MLSVVLFVFFFLGALSAALLYAHAYFKKAVSAVERGHSSRAAGHMTRSLFFCAGAMGAVNVLALALTQPSASALIPLALLTIEFLARLALFLTALRFFYNLARRIPGNRLSQTDLVLLAAASPFYLLLAAAAMSPSQWLLSFTS